MTYRDFIRRRQVGCSLESSDLSLLEDAGLNRVPDRKIAVHMTEQQPATDVAPRDNTWFASLLKNMTD